MINSLITSLDLSAQDNLNAKPISLNYKDKNGENVINNNIDPELLGTNNTFIIGWQWRDGWTYKDTIKVWDDFSYTWLGPMAQDFNSRFNFGSGDSTLLNSATMDAVMFASIQALADMIDNHSQTLMKEKEKIDSIDIYTKELLTKSEFEEFKNDFDCLDSICERVSTLEADYTDFKNNSSTFITKSDFNSFKDSISCYSEACNKINELEETIEELLERIEELESKNTSDSTKKMVFISNYNFEDVLLEQNNPNPFEIETKISYYIPNDYSGQAELLLTDERGMSIIQKLDACIGKPCSISINANELNSGVYIYSLVLDGNIIKSKKMMIIK